MAALRAHGSLKATETIIARGSSGASETSTHTITLHYKKRSRAKKKK